MNKTKITVLGGDARLFYVSRDLADMGYEVNLFGNDLHAQKCDKIIYPKTLSDAVRSADALLLPLPYTRDKVSLDAPLSTSPISLGDLFDAADEKTLIIAGMADGIPRKFKIYDYANDEEYIQRNALASAEGALAAIIKEIPVTVSGLDVAILGYGRIAKLLSRMLYSLGARVTIVARNPVDRARAETENLAAVSFDGLKDLLRSVTCVINTVPHTVIKEEHLSLASEELTVIELASSPGGCDRKALSDKGIRLVSAPGLPGKYSPISAARALSRLVTDIISNRI